MTVLVGCVRCKDAKVCYSLDMVQDRLIFLLSSSAVEGTYSLELVFFLPLFGMNSLTHSPLAAAISLKIGRVEILLGDDGEGHGDIGDMSQEYLPR